MKRRNTPLLLLTDHFHRPSMSLGIFVTRPRHSSKQKHVDVAVEGAKREAGEEKTDTRQPIVGKPPPLRRKITEAGPPALSQSE